MRFGFVTLFPAAIRAHMEDSVIGRAASRGLLSWRTADPRDYAYDAHRKVDDTPYGGEPGMLMKAEPVALALASLRPEGAAVVVTEPGGRRFDQTVARELAEYQHVVFVCGHYEGIDHRFEEEFATHVLSIGDFVLTGGELPALVMADAVARLVPGVLGSAESLNADSFDEPGSVSAPNYTRPPVWRGRAVPDVLMSGDHARIAAWRQQESRIRTLHRERGWEDDDLLEYDRWANSLVGRDIALYGEEAQERYRHILGALAIWSERLGEPSPSEIEPLYEALRRARSRWRPSDVVHYRNLKGVPSAQTARRIFQHLIVHGAYHRGEIRRLAEQAGAEFSDTDLLLFDLAKQEIHMAKQEIASASADGNRA